MSKAKIIRTHESTIAIFSEINIAKYDMSHGQGSKFRFVSNETAETFLFRQPPKRNTQGIPKFHFFERNENFYVCFVRNDLNSRETITYVETRKGP